MNSGYGYNPGDELVSADETNVATGTLADHESWGLDLAGNWLSHTRSSGSVLETRTVNALNQIKKIGGEGETVVAGHVNEFARVDVNGAQAEVTPDPATGGYFFKRKVPVTAGDNTINITATDPQGESTSENWKFAVSHASRNFRYDANGNTLSDGIRNYTWDAKNRLTTVTKGNTIWKWDYDYQDRRVREYQDNVLTKIFIWSGSLLIQERNASNVITRTHYSGGFSDGPTPLSGTKYQVLTDHLGNIREVLTAAGAIAARYDYTPYQGAAVIGTGTVQPTFLTIGNYYHHAGSGLDLALYRAYDPELGKWLSADPIGEKGGVNLYGYVGNNPVNYWDPFGLEACLKVYRASRTSISTVMVYENNEYVGGYYGNRGGYSPGTRAPAAGTYYLLPKTNYDPGDKFVNGTPSITKKGLKPGQPDPSAKGTHRVHPESKSEGCLTGPVDWSNRIWDIMKRNLTTGGTRIIYIDTEVLMGLPEGQTLSPPTSHTWPVFGLKGIEPIPTK